MHEILVAFLTFYTLFSAPMQSSIINQLHRLTELEISTFCADDVSETVSDSILIKNAK